MESLTLTLIQTALHWENAAANLDMFSEKIAALSPTQLIILPEMFPTGFTMNPRQHAEPKDGCARQWMIEQSKKKNAIITGSIATADDGRYFNRMLWVLPNGQVGEYDKRHLFAFAEEDKHYSPGNTRSVARANGFSILLQVCYDLRFPVWARQQGKAGIPEYDLIVYVANWPEARSHAWRTLLQARAIENQCYVAGVNRVGEDAQGVRYSGNSMLVDPSGELLWEGNDGEEIHTATISRKNLTDFREKFPFLRDKDDFNLLL